MIALWHRLPENFEQQLGIIGGKAEAYHFDDGADDALRAADALEAMGLRGVFFVITSRIGADGWVTRAMLRELVERGHEVGNHTHTHRPMDELPAADVRDDIAAAQDTLAGITGVPQRFAWPHGRHSYWNDLVAAEFDFVEARDISRVVRRIAMKPDRELARLFR